MIDNTRKRAWWRAARTGVVVAAVAAGSLASVGLAQAQAAQPLIAVPGSASPGATAHRDSAVAANQQVTVGVSLTLRDAAGLAAFDTAVSTPGNAEYGHYLTAAQFAAKYSPTQAQVNQVQQYLTAAGLKVTGVTGNRQVVDASGTASQVSSAFHTTLSNYTNGSNHYRTNDSAVSLPSSVSGLVQGVSGLDSRAIAHPQLVTPKVTTPNATPSGYGPTQYNGAYRFNDVGEDGTGITVALWEFDGYTASDLTTYESQYGLSGPAATTVSVDGANYNSNPGQGQGEVELDSDIVRGVAPKASQLVYEAPNSNQGQIDMANQIVSQDKVQVISISWGGCEAEQGSSEMTSTDNALSQAVSEGMTVYSASGDNGSADCQSGATGVDYTASSPYVSGAGGTTLGVSGTTWSSETAWSGSGGGVSTVYAKPSWQTSSGSKRTVPDISGNADYPGSPYAIYIAGSWTPVGGTSCVAPLWSGFTALVDEKAKAAGKATMGLINPALYAAATANYSGNFHDITSGSNGGFSAGPGVDDVTGIGSPIGDTLANTLVGGGTGPGGNTVTVTSPGNQNTSTGSSVNLTVTGSDSAGAALTWSATGLPTGLSINATSGVISGTANTAGTYSVTVTAKDSTGASGSASFTWTVGTSGGGCTSAQELGNAGFESGNTVWSASSGVIAQNGAQGEPTHSGSYDAWLDGYGSTHTDTVSQSVTIPAGCSATLSFYLHIDTAETSKTTQYDKLTVKLGSTTLATFSNLNAASGYTQHSYNVASLAGQTVTLTFTGTEDSVDQTSFVLDDTALNVS
ncbi:MAG TPA: protease pro-enzyme activation domain-containing protein [Pseudonocardiaceae bacterium]|nr:protease pro-enzyme activation domain-containing protein [Pseudonocardiaceae bacterium]